MHSVSVAPYSLILSIFNFGVYSNSSSLAKFAAKKHNVENVVSEAIISLALAGFAFSVFAHYRVVSLKLNAVFRVK